MSPLLLEVVGAPSGIELQVGQRLALPALLGRGEDNEISIPLRTLARRHCRFTVSNGRAWLEDLQSTNGTYVNGSQRHAKVELHRGDFVELPWGVVFEVVDGSPRRPLFDESSEAFRLVVADVHDEGRWRLWADALLERGDALAERLVHGRGADLADDAKALGRLARDFVTGSLEVEWRHGFVRRAVLRNITEWPSTPWPETFAAVLAHPLSRFIEELEVDVLSWARSVDRVDRTQAEERIVQSLALLAAAQPLPSLQSVRYGPSPDRLWSARLEGAWRKATERHGRLQVGPIWVARAAWLQLLSTPPGVTVLDLEVGAQRALKDDRATLVGPGDCAFALDAPDGSPASRVALRLDRENGLWVAEDIAADYRWEMPLYVNGRRCRRARIRPQDVLEPAPGLTFRFVME